MCDGEERRGTGNVDVVLLARQPILDAEGSVKGHELLFRHPWLTPADVPSAQATAHVISSAFGDLDLDEVSGCKPVWLNVSGEFLIDMEPFPLPPDRVVLELLEDTEIDDALLGRLERLRAEGFELALDDFVPTADRAVLLEYATWVKLDVRALDPTAFATACAVVRRAGCRVVAEKVETAAERDACLAAGADRLQGWYYARPELIEGRAVPHGSLAPLRAALELAQVSSFEEVERCITRDPGLSLRLLRYVNSAAFEARAPVAGTHDAILRVGTQAVRQWALLIALADLGGHRPAALATGLVRAKLCEGLARAAGARAPAAWFTVGLLSVVDALLDQPRDAIIEPLPLIADVRGALLHHSGAMGAALRDAVAIERGELNPQLDPGLYRYAVAWADQVLGTN